MKIKYTILQQTTVIDYLESFHLSKSKIYKLFLEGNIKVNGENCQRKTILNKNDISILEFKVEPKFVAELVELVQSKQINSSQGKEIFAKMVKENKSPLKLQKELGATLISDEKTIRKLVLEVLAQNVTLRDDYKAGKTRAQGFVMGQIMKKTGGKVNPGIANKVIVEELKK